MGVFFPKERKLLPDYSWIIHFYYIVKTFLMEGFLSETLRIFRMIYELFLPPEI